jgi:hypothetical protein
MRSRSPGTSRRCRLAHEIGRRVADDTGEPELALTVENEARDVLLDYWLGKLPPEG